MTGERRTPPGVVVVVGNPKPGSRTRAAAIRLARELTGEDPDLVLDLVELGPAVLDWSDEVVADLVEDVGRASLVVVASPTYKGSYTGLLKLFLDRFAAGTGLRGLAVPLMLGAAPSHAMAPEVALRPVLTELGATVPGRGLFVLDSAVDDPGVFDEWVASNASLVRAVLRRELTAVAS